MYRILIFLLVILFLSQCSSKTERTTKSIDRDSLILDSASITFQDRNPEKPTLEDTISQIREWFKIINRNASSGNYNKEIYSIRYDSTLTEITEFNETVNEDRMKIIFRSNLPSYDLPLTDSTTFSNITREYYYWDNELFFIYEIFTFNNKSDFENRFYLAENRLIRWIHGTTHVNDSIEIFRKVELDLLTRKNNLLQSFNYFKRYRKEDKLFANKKEGLFDSFKEVAYLRYPDIDSIKILFVNNFDSKYVYEIYETRNNVSNSHLYTLEVDETSNQWEATERLIGTLAKNETEITSPGEFFYYVMDINRKSNLEKLRRLIPENGYKTNVVVAVGDEEPQYEHDFTISKDTITFHDLNFNFTPSIFNFHVTIDKEFDQNGETSISYWGGGFSEAVRIKKKKNEIYLISHNSHDH